MNTLKRIRDEINSLTANLTDTELFTSTQFAEYIRESLKTALGKLARRKVDLVMINDESRPAGCTNGETVYLNIANTLLDGCTRLEKYYVLLGITIHEAGHRLFTDFAYLNKFMDQWRVCLMMNADAPAPVDEDPRWNYMIEELRELPNLMRYFLRDVVEVGNIGEDGYIEQLIYRTFSGVFTMGLSTTNRKIFGKDITLSEKFDAIIMQEDADKKAILLMTVLKGEMLRMIKDFPEYRGTWESTDAEKNELYRQVCAFKSNVSGLIDDWKFESDSEERYRICNKVMLELYEYYPGRNEQEDEDENSASDSSEDQDNSTDAEKSENSGKSSRHDISPDTSMSGESPSCSTAIPIGNTKPVEMEPSEETEEEEKEEAKEAKERADELSESEATSREFESAMGEIKRAIAEANVEDEHNSEMESEADEIQSHARPQGRLPEPWKYQMVRKRSKYITSYEKDMYRDIMSEMRSYSEPTKRKLNTVLTKRAEIGSSKGYQIGRFDPTQYPKAFLIGDGRTFRQNRLPNGQPSVAFGILIDESGSMEGSKIMTARKSAILLNDILEGVNVPHIICGHTADTDTCEIRAYHDFDEVDSMDKYRLTGICDSWGNRDGAAIAYCCEKLMKRPEQDKILIVISDGWPTECGYFSRDAQEDTMETLRRYRRKGIDIIGAVIDCYEDIEKIYGRQHCLDLTDLSKLPSSLSSLVKRYILR